MALLSMSRNHRFAGAAVLAGALLTGCLNDGTAPREFRIEDATLLSRPAAPVLPATLGFSSLGIGGQRDGFLYVPSTYNADTPAPLVVLLHGAGETSLQWHNDDLSGIAEEFGLVILAPDSRLRSWDLLVRGSFAGDVPFIDGALDHVFERVNVDPARVAMAGFSDGGSYALSLGLINGDLFTHVVGFSPALIFAPERRGEPGVYLTHGSNDGVIPVSNSRDNLVPLLRQAGYTVEFVEFNGGHSLPVAVARTALAWVTGATP
jgi:phospholipase/carboxylesterase